MTHKELDDTFRVVAVCRKAYADAQALADFAKTHQRLMESTEELLIEAMRRRGSALTNWVKAAGDLKQPFDINELLYGTWETVGNFEAELDARQIGLHVRQHGDTYLPKHWETCDNCGNRFHENMLTWSNGGLVCCGCLFTWTKNQEKEEPTCSNSLNTTSQPGGTGPA